MKTFSFSGEEASFSGISIRKYGNKIIRDTKNTADKYQAAAPFSLGMKVFPC